MTELERQILDKFKSLRAQRVRLHQMILFGSRARGDADEDSDMDVLVLLDDEGDEDTREYISHCAWEVGFESGSLVMPVVYGRHEWENAPVRSSLLALGVKADGIPLMDSTTLPPDLASCEAAHADDVRVLACGRLDSAYDSLRSAQLLLESGGTSCGVINLSYYGMYYAVLALLQCVGRVPSKNKRALSLFDEEFADTGKLRKELSDDFHRVSDLCESLDFALSESPSSEVAEEVHERAVNFVDAIKTYFESQCEAFVVSEGT